MARKSETTWELVATQKAQVNLGDNAIGDPYLVEQRFALRTKEGVLLKKTSFKEMDGKPKHDTGWKIQTRKPVADAREKLLAQGFKEV